MVTINEISLKKWQDDNAEHLRYEYDLNPTDTVLDIGSYRREFSDEIIKRYGCKVECFDALDNKAAWLFDGKIHVGGDFLYTSIYADKIDKEYFCVDIAKYLQNPVGLVKINIEGGEYALLLYIIEKGLISNIKNLQVQFHEVQGIDYDGHYKTLARLLFKTHQVTYRYPFCWENWELRC